MEYTYTQLFALIAGTALCLLAVAVLSPLSVARATEALLERVELGLARRAKRRAARADEGVRLPIFEHYQHGRAHR